MSVSQSNSLAKANKLAGYTFFGGYTEVLPYSQVIVRINTTSATNSYILSIYYSNNKTTPLVVNSTAYTNQTVTVANSGPQGAYVKVHVELLEDADNLTIDTMFKTTTIYDVSTASLGSVTVTSGNIVVDSVTDPVAVTGTFYQETQPVSIADEVVVENGVVDEENSSNIPLVAPSTRFTGLYKSTLNIAQIDISVESDQSGGLDILYSSDGINLGFIDNELCIGGVPNLFNLQPKMNYFYVVYTTDADQAYFRLKTTMRSSVSYTSSQPVTGTFYQATQPVSIADNVSVKNGVVDGNNSTVIPLLVGQTFLGTQRSTLDVAQISLTCESDASGTINFHFSSDGFNPGYTATRPLIANAINQYNHEPIMNYYFIEIIPDADQSFLRLTSTLRSVVSFIEVQEVAIVNGPLAVTGPLTDEQLRAAAVPVSIATEVAVTGTFFQATQPISIAEDVTVTGTFFQATQPISIAENVAVTGTFFQVTQPISIAEDVAVTGTFFQATQPISIATSVAVTGTFFQETQPISLPEDAVVLTQESPTVLSYYGYNFGNTGTVVSAVGKIIRNLSLNTTGAILTYVYFYDMATAPSSADTPVFMYVIQNSNNVVFNSFDHEFINGIGIRATTTLNGTVSPVANSVIVNMTLSD